LRRDLEQQARSEGVADRVLFAGFRHDASELLPAIDIVVFSSLFEGLPIALLEAMSAARPIVATHAGGIPEVVDDGVEALLVPPADPESLAAALSRLLADRELRLQLGQGARQRLLAQFTVESMVKSYDTVYREVVPGYAAATPA
jgi:glycosyltransferase involved in cell wall biosynthesis